MEDKEPLPKVCDKCLKEMHGFCFDHGDFCLECHYMCPKCNADA